MPNRAKPSRLVETLDRLEQAYGVLVGSEDAVEAAILALLAEHAPDLSKVQSRQALREWFVDWNEMRVADPWDISSALGAGGHSGARAFAKAALKMLGSVHAVLNRCSFDRARANPEADLEAVVAKMRNVPPHARAVMLAVLAEDDEWRPDKEVAKFVQKVGLVPKTTSLPKIAKALAAAAGEDDRLRAHYLLTRYAHRSDDDADPLAGAAAPKRAEKSTDAEPAAPAAKPAKQPKPAKAAKKTGGAAKPPRSKAAKAK